MRLVGPKVGFETPQDAWSTACSMVLASHALRLLPSACAAARFSSGPTLRGTLPLAEIVSLTGHSIRVVPKVGVAEEPVLSCAFMAVGGVGKGPFVAEELWRVRYGCQSCQRLPSIVRCDFWESGRYSLRLLCQIQLSFHAFVSASLAMRYP